MRVAIPIWGDKISPVLDTATRLMIVDAGAGKATRTALDLEGDDLSRRCSRLKEHGVDTLICSAVSNAFCRGLYAANIEVIQGISGPVEEVLAAYLEGDLFREAYLMPGCHPEGRGRHYGKSSIRPCGRMCNGAEKGQGGRRGCRDASSNQKTRK